MKTLFLLFLLVVIVGGGVYYFHFYKPVPAVIEDARLMSIESYVKQNISELSPIKETLGGKFVVTKIDIQEGAGTVYYEDGHNAYIADFSYYTNEKTGIGMDTFVVRR